MRELTWPVSLDRYPHFRSHRVRGIATAPGSFEMELAARAARKAHPELIVTGFSDCVFSRFVRLREGQEVVLRTQVLESHADGAETACRVRVVSDFVHQSGRVLESDVAHFDCLVQLGRTAPVLAGRSDWTGRLRGALVPDPYTLPDSPVTHAGLFNHLHQIVLGEDIKRCAFRLGGDRSLDGETDHVTPWLLVDAFITFALLGVDSQGLMPVYAPVRIRKVRFATQLNDWGLHALPEDVLLTAPNPSPSAKADTAEVETIGWLQATDARGQVLAEMEDPELWLFGTVAPSSAEDGAVSPAHLMAAQ